MRPIFKYLQQSILLLFLCSPALGDVDIEMLRATYPKCDDPNYLHNCFYKVDLGGTSYQIGYFRENKIWEGEYYSDNYLSGYYVDGEFDGIPMCSLETLSGWYVCRNGDRFKLEGNGFIANGKIEGPAIYEYANGGKYIGDHKQSLSDGQGTKYYSNGDRYEGEWVKNLMNGQGIYYYADGSRYEGEWVKDQKSSQGTLYHSNGDRYDGEWVRNQMNGQGIYYFSDGTRYEGEWHDDKLNGFATYYLADGTITQQGMYKDDVFLYSAAPPSNNRPRGAETDSDPKIITLDSAKTTCAEIGYKIGTEKYADCVMKLLD